MRARGLDRIPPQVLLILTVSFWAGNWVIARGIQGQLSPIAMAFWRWVGAFLLLAPFVAGPMRAEWPVIRKSLPLLAVLGLLGVCAFNALTYTGLKYTSATTGVLLNSVIPILIIALNFVMFRARVSPLQACGVLISFAGVFVIVIRGDLAQLRHVDLNRGDLWVLGAMLAWSLYTVLLRFRPMRLSSRAFTGSVIFCGVIALIPLFAWDAQATSPAHWHAGTLAAVAYFAVFPSVAAYFFWNSAVARIGPDRAGVFLHLMPVFGTILAVLFLGERVYGYHWFGTALIFMGIFVATRASLQR